MAEIPDHVRQRLADIRKNVIALKWQTEELIKVSRKIVWQHYQLIEQRRAQTDCERGRRVVGDNGQAPDRIKSPT